MLRLCCCAQPADETRDVIVRLLESGIGWKRFLSLAKQNGVTALAAARLLARERGASLPDAVERQLTLLVEATLLRNQHLAARLIEIFELLKRAGISSLAIKGVTLAAAAHRDPGLRAFGDLDLVVQRADVMRAIAVLGNHGFTSKHWNAGAFASGFFSDTSIDLAGPDLVLDLHWQLAPDYFPFGPDTARAFEYRVEADLGGGRVATLGPLDTVLFQASHAAKHGWGRLQYVCDFSNVMNAASQIEFESLLRAADAAGCRTMLLTGVSLASSILSAAPPRPLLNLAAFDPRIAALCASVERRMFELRDEGMFDEWAIAMRSIDAAGDRFRYLGRRLLRPRLSDAALLRLPPALFPLYYLARPALLAIKHGRSLFDANA